ncbi:hypothetical protein [Gehongia tenuis]|uniref:Uncharacterized protein n=1 Tax=Gehongia tenuis TaxID=2763655 RepID=A0A926D435_9FIRM|nr:hypothetical protein [Gehongia tenuis]MBC8532030.1 hypothetical protein [Gehongia tenuis]
MQTCKKMLSVILCAAMLLWAFPSVRAEGASVSKDENVYIILNPDGSIQKQTDSVWLHSDNGFDRFADPSTLSDVVNIKSDVQPQAVKGGLTWTTQDHDLYYQGTPKGTPPVTMAISYTLNGQPKTAEELLGQSGELEIQIKLLNHEKQDKTIAGETRPIYTPFAMALVLDLPVDHFTNIDAGDSEILSESSHQILTLLVFPGMSENLGELLDSEYLSDLKDLLQDEFTIRAQVTDFEMPGILGAAATDLADLSDLSVSSDMAKLFSGMDQLQSASGELESGTSLLTDALNQYKAKMEAFRTKYAEFDSGLNTALSGADSLKSGAGRLKSAASTLKARVTDELIPAIEQAAPLQKKLNDELALLKEQLSGLQLPDMDGLELQLSGALGDVCDGSSDATIRILTGKSLSELPEEQQQQILGARSQIKSQAAGSLAQAMGQLDLSALGALKSTLTDIEGLADELMGGMSGLTAALYDPNDDPENPQTLAAAILALSQGAGDLDQGAASLTQGLQQLKGASSEILNVIRAFDENAGTLSEKSGEIHRGMSQFNREGMAELNNGELRSDLDTLEAIRSEMDSQAQAYSSYAGAPSGAETSVKFIFKVEGPKAAKDAPTAQAPVQNEQPGFWERLKNLFKNIF